MLAQFSHPRAVVNHLKSLLLITLQTMLNSNTAKTQMPTFLPSFLKSVALKIAPAAVALSALPGLAQTPSPSTICSYDPDSGFPNPLGSRATLTVVETEGDTAFVYERLPSIVSSDRATVRADVDNQRTLTLYETPIAEARQLLTDDATYYAVLLGLSADDPFIARGFELIDQTLACEPGNSDTTEIPAPLSPLAQPSTPPAP